MQFLIGNWMALFDKIDFFFRGQNYKKVVFYDSVISCVYIRNSYTRHSFFAIVELKQIIIRKDTIILCTLDGETVIMEKFSALKPEGCAI